MSHTRLLAPPVSSSIQASVEARVQASFTASVVLFLILAATAVAEESTNSDVTVTKVDTLAQIEGGTGGLSIDQEGNLYSSEFGDSLGNSNSGGTRVFHITPEGKTRVFADGLKGASGSELDAEGNLFQSNIRGAVLSKITPDGQVTTFAAKGFVNPVGIATGKDGFLYVADCGANKLVKVNEDGSTEIFAQDPLLRCPNGITVDDAGNFYVANFYNGDVLKVTPKAEVTRFATLPGNNNGHLVFQGGVLYVAGRGAHQVFRLRLDGTFDVIAGSGNKGGTDGAPEDAAFCYPNDIAASPDGRYLYVNEVADETSKGMDLEPTRIRRLELARDP